MPWTSVCGVCPPSASIGPRKIGTVICHAERSEGLSMTVLSGCVSTCANVMWFDLGGHYLNLERRRG
jgi:hypothetical protein